MTVQQALNEGEAASLHLSLLKLADAVKAMNAHVGAIIGSNLSSNYIDEFGQKDAQSTWKIAVVNKQNNVKDGHEIERRRIDCIASDDTREMLNSPFVTVHTDDEARIDKAQITEEDKATIGAMIIFVKRCRGSYGINIEQEVRDNEKIMSSAEDKRVFATIKTLQAYAVKDYLVAFGASEHQVEVTDDFGIRFDAPVGDRVAR